MQTRRQFVKSVPALGAGILLAETGAATAQTQNVLSAQGENSWSSPSLRSETVVGPNGAVTTRTTLLANEKWGIGDKKHVEQVTDGVYAMRGWGIASSFAIEAPKGWIIIDTGDFTRAATLGFEGDRLVLRDKDGAIAIVMERKR